MAELFGVSLKTISEHLQNLFKSGELSEETVLRKSRITAADGKAYLTSLYDLNAIIAVGYKVNSKKAAEFRKWSATVLKGYIQDGYALNGKRLNSDPRALLKLAREVRAIRTSETNLYTQVRETFAECSTDYDQDDPAARTFFATSQDSFHFAASEQTAVQIIMSRADATKPKHGPDSPRQPQADSCGCDDC
ncbi:virulence RhuM family protein [Mesorhizobium sp. M1088]|uniref:RhuM family protein n=1 Tax=Mesorhizobium sp. M1088 TaxID=2957056 RepID=UPI00333D919D